MGSKVLITSSRVLCVKLIQPYGSAIGQHTDYQCLKNSGQRDQAWNRRSLLSSLITALGMPAAAELCEEPTILPRGLRSNPQDLGEPRAPFPAAETPQALLCGPWMLNDFRGLRHGKVTGCSCLSLPFFQLKSNGMHMSCFAAAPLICGDSWTPSLGVYATALRSLAWSNA